MPKRHFCEVNLLGNYRARAKIEVFCPSVFCFIFDTIFDEFWRILGPPRSPKAGKSLYEMKIFGSGNSLEEKKRTKKDKNQDLTKDIISLYVEQKLKNSMVFWMGHKRQILNISKDVEQKLMLKCGYGRGPAECGRPAAGLELAFSSWRIW